MNTILQTAFIDAVYDNGQRVVNGTTTRAQDILPAEYESKRTRCTVTTARRWDSFKTKMRMRFLQAPSGEDPLLDDMAAFLETTAKQTALSAVQKYERLGDFHHPFNSAA